MSTQRASQLVEAGLWLRLSGDQEGARRLFEQALKLDPGNVRARQLLESSPPSVGQSKPSTQSPAAPPPSIPDPFARPDAGNKPVAPVDLDWGSATGFDEPPPPPMPPPPAPTGTPGVQTVTLGEPPSSSSTLVFGRKDAAPFDPFADQRPTGPDRFDFDAPSAPVEPPRQRAASSQADEPFLPFDSPPETSTLVFGGDAPQVEDDGHDTLVYGSEGPGRGSTNTLSFGGRQGAAPPLQPAPGNTLVFASGGQVPNLPPMPVAPPVSSQSMIFNQSGMPVVPPVSPTESTTLVFGSEQLAPQPSPRPPGPAQSSTLVFGTGTGTPPPPAMGFPEHVGTLVYGSVPTGLPSAHPLPPPPFAEALAPPMAPSAPAAPAAPEYEVPLDLHDEVKTTGWDGGSNPGINLDQAHQAPPQGVGFDLISNDVPPPPRPRSPAQVRDEVDTLLRGAKDLLDLDDHTGAMELMAKAQELDPANAEVQRLQARSEQTLVTMYESKLGNLEATPRVKLKDDEIIWLNLDHRAGFVLAQIDGSISFEDVFAVSGMTRLDTARILSQLVEEGVVSRG